MQNLELLERIKALAKPIHPESFDHPITLKTITGIKCVAFDFYGTMFISGVGDIGVDEAQKSAQKRFFKSALESAAFAIIANEPGAHGLEQFQDTIEQHIEQQKKQGIDHPEPDIVAVWQEVLENLVSLGIINGPVTKENTIRFAIEFEFRANTIWPVPDLEKILDQLLNYGLTLGIISNSQFYTPLAFRALMDKTTDDFGFHPELQKWSYKFGVKKPSLDFYRKFTNSLPACGLAPEEVLYVGNDLFKDVAPANALGMRTALYVGDRRSLRHEDGDLSKDGHRPDVVIDDLHQVLECLPL